MHWITIDRNDRSVVEVFLVRVSSLVVFSTVGVMMSAKGLVRVVVACVW